MASSSLVKSMLIVQAVTSVSAIKLGARPTVTMQYTPSVPKWPFAVPPVPAKTISKRRSFRNASKSFTKKLFNKFEKRVSWFDGKGQDEIVKENNHLAAKNTRIQKIKEFDARSEAKSKEKEALRNKLEDELDSAGVLVKQLGVLKSMIEEEVSPAYMEDEVEDNSMIEHALNMIVMELGAAEISIDEVVKNIREASDSGSWESVTDATFATALESLTAVHDLVQMEEIQEETILVENLSDAAQEFSRSINDLRDVVDKVKNLDPTPTWYTQDELTIFQAEEKIEDMS